MVESRGQISQINYMNRKCDTVNRNVSNKRKAEYIETQTILVGPNQMVQYWISLDYIMHLTRMNTTALLYGDLSGDISII